MLRCRPFSVRAIALPMVAVAHSVPAEVPLQVKGNYVGNPDKVEELGGLAINENGGYALVLERNGYPEEDESWVWGGESQGWGEGLRQERCIGGLCQRRFGDSVGMSNSGQLIYVAFSSGMEPGARELEGVWLGDSLLALESEAVPSLPGHFWVGEFEVGVSGRGTPYWRGRYALEPDGAAVGEGLFFGLEGEHYFRSGQTFSGLPDPVGGPNAIGANYHLSSQGSHWIAEVVLQPSAAADYGAVVQDGRVVQIAGSPVAVGSLLPESAGGLPGERWERFVAVGVNEAGAWVVAGETTAEDARDGVLVVSGDVSMREGERIGGGELLGQDEGVLRGEPRYAYLSEDGDVALLWNADYVQADELDTLILNGRAVLIEETTFVDTDGDDVEEYVIIDWFDRPDSIRVSPRGRRGMVAIHFVATPADPIRWWERWEAYLRVLVDPTWGYLDFMQGTLTMGEEAAFRVVGGAVGERVEFLYSLQGEGDGPCPNLYGGLCLDLLPPVKRLGDATTGDDGAANLVVAVPEVRGGATVATQAVVERPGNEVSLKTSPLVEPFRPRDGFEWVRVAEDGPPSRENAAMAFDSNRGVMVLFGGRLANGDLSDTWEWDGVEWTLVDDYPPWPRSGAAMAFDSNRGVVVLFGGSFYGDTWEWDGTEWTLESEEGPPGRRDHAMAFDERRGVTILYGGQTSEGLRDDTWVWNGSRWKQVAQGEPGENYLHAMVYDPRRRNVIMFADGDSAIWEWVGDGWQRIETTGPGPDYRSQHALAADTLRQVVVMYGGVGYLAENTTWEWDGLQWRQVAIDGSYPGDREAHSMGFDSFRGETVLFGDDDYVDTWAFRPIDSPVPPSPSPR